METVRDRFIVSFADLCLVAPFVTVVLFPPHLSNFACLRRVEAFPASHCALQGHFPRICGFAWSGNVFSRHRYSPWPLSWSMMKSNRFDPW